MRILYIASNTSLKNGASKCLLEILKGGVDKDIVPFVCVPDYGELCIELDKIHVTYFIVPEYTWVWRKSIGTNFNIIKKIKFFMRKYIYNMFSVYKISRIIKNYRIDIVHINTLTTYIGAVAAKASKVPYVWHIREFMEEDLESEFCDRSYSIKLLNNSSAVLCISKAIFNKYSKILDNNILNLVYDGVNQNTFHLSRQEIFNDTDINILMLGRFVKTKGQYDLVRAINILNLKGIINIKCKIIGQYADAEYVNLISSYIDANSLREIISLHDYVSSPELLLNKADILCVCSVAEAFGLVTVEGMMSGCLVMGADSGCTAELVDNYKNGILYKCGDYVDLARMIYWVIAHKCEAKKIASQGCTDSIQKYSLEQNINNIIRIYNIILK